MTRVIAGRAGSLQLEVPKSGTRPTSDRVREAIFSALESWNLIASSRVLDLYAGSGALGLEAASRGAAEVVLVEKHPPAAQIAARNAKKVLAAFRNENDAPRIETVRGAVQGYLEGVGTGAASGTGAGRSTDTNTGASTTFDVIMLDPPYDISERELAENLAALAPLLTDDGIVLVERSSRSPEPIWPSGEHELALVRERRYGETVLWWAEAGARAASSSASALDE